MLFSCWNNNVSRIPLVQNPIFESDGLTACSAGKPGECRAYPATAAKAAGSRAPVIPVQVGIHCAPESTQSATDPSAIAADRAGNRGPASSPSPSMGEGQGGGGATARSPPPLAPPVPFARRSASRPNPRCGGGPGWGCLRPLRPWLRATTWATAGEGREQLRGSLPIPRPAPRRPSSATIPKVRSVPAEAQAPFRPPRDPNRQRKAPQPRHADSAPAEQASRLGNPGAAS